MGPVTGTFQAQLHWNLHSRADLETCQPQPGPWEHSVPFLPYRFWSQITPPEKFFGKLFYPVLVARIKAASAISIPCGNAVHPKRVWEMGSVYCCRRVLLHTGVGLMVWSPIIYLCAEICSRAMRTDLCHPFIPGRKKHEGSCCFFATGSKVNCVSCC
jgi:hypothetical protein